MKAKCKSKVYPHTVEICDETKEFITFISHGEVHTLSRKIFYFLFNEAV
jgi:hypothetical protein